MDLRDYDIYHLGVSGGKDSTALLLWAVNESGFPCEKIRASFCDTGNEHEFTYEYIRMLSEKIHPIETIKPPIDFYELAKKKGRFPSPKARFCTQQLKIFPTQARVLDLTKNGERVLLMSGVRAGESKDRSDLPEFEWDEYYAADMYRPLLRWSLEDVWAFLGKYGIPRNPLYDFGARRVGCFPCIMSNKYELRVIARHFPERIDKIRDAELDSGSDRNQGFSSFFSRNVVPERFRSREVVSDSGEKILVPTIDDVVEWSKTGHHRPRQYEMDLFDRAACQSNLGMCE